MQVIHFTAGAMDWLSASRAGLTRLVPLARGDGDLQLYCVHLIPGTHIVDPSTTHDSAVLVVNGEVLLQEDVGCRTELLSGMGAIIKAGQSYRLECARGAIVLTLESRHLKGPEEGISAPASVGPSC